MTLSLTLTRDMATQLLISTTSAKLLTIGSNQECTEVRVVGIEPKFD